MGPTCVSGGFTNAFHPAFLIQLATIRGFDLRFHVKDDDGSGKCDAFYTGKDEDFIMGVVYDIEATEKHLLDKAEDLGIEYEERETTAETKDGTIEVFLYTAKSDVINNQMIPFDWYKKFVVFGAREHGFTGRLYTDA